MRPTRLHDLSLRQKMSLVVLVASAVALALVAGAVVVYEVTTFRPRVERDLKVQADVLRANLHAPLNFEDRVAAAENLRSLSATPEILAAAVYRGRELFATYVAARADGGPRPPPLPPWREEGVVYDGSRLEMSEPIVYEDELLGHLVLRRHLPPLFRRLPQYTLMAGVVLVALLVVSLLLTLGLERLVSAPLVQLAAAARAVRDRQDYAVRVPGRGEDEIGDLTRAFNQMLDTIDERERALREVARDLDRGRRELQRELLERHRVEAALRESERFIQKLADSMPSLLYVQDVVERRNTYVNREAEAILGYPVETILGGDGAAALEVPHPDDPEVLAERLRRLAAADDGEIVATEYRMRRADGAHRWLQSRDTVFERDAEGRPRLVLGVAQDVTEQMELQGRLVQAQKMESIGRLAGGVAHDFNNLLTVIVGSTDLVALDLGPGHAAQPFLDNVRQASEQAAELTHQLLAFARRQVIEPKVLDLGELALEAEGMLRSMIGEDVGLAVVPSPSRWPIRADPGQMMQVLMNLAVNARDAMPAGGRLTIATESLELADGEPRHGVPPGRWVRLTVSDDGIGMDEATRARVFEPFFTTKEHGKGTGLGLSTCYGIVRQSEGHVAVDSELGVGSSFYVYLPAADADADESGVTRAVRSPLPQGEETVLVVEDNPLVRATTVSILRAQGYTVLEAASGPDALRLSDAAGSLHLLLTDVVMPQMGGPELAQRLLARRPGLRVLYTSGYTADATTLHDARAGVAFLQKPYTSEGLIRKVRKVLDG